MTYLFLLLVMTMIKKTAVSKPAGFKKAEVHPKRKMVDGI
jgi:hypothetical protein